uniref:CSON004836 protein n=1 Tax=Culicoides sonorensis TaxID=179676 RepID=A0A336MPW6_CULSO
MLHRIPSLKEATFERSIFMRWSVDNRRKHRGFAQQDFHNLDINRFLGLHNNRRFLRNRSMEVPGRHYSISYPYFGEFNTGRNIR